jgi:hypothetical protein
MIGYLVSVLAARGKLFAVEALLKRRATANLAGLGWIACSVQGVVPRDELCKGDNNETG